LQEVSPDLLRRSRILKKLADLIKNKPILIEYSGLLLDRYRKNPKVTQTLIKRDIRDLTEFYQRYPGIIEQGLLLQAVLPSEIFDKPLKAKIDYLVYTTENANLNIETIDVYIKEEVYKVLKEIAEQKDENHIFFAIKKLKDKILENIYDGINKNKIKIGSF
jgi:hypothetical protein